MTLGELIAHLKSLPQQATLRRGIWLPHSYRGYYEQLGFEIKDNQPVHEALNVATGCMGHTFEGYKGGEYTMRDDTICWRSEYGTTADSEVLTRYELQVIDEPQISESDWRIKIEAELSRVKAALDVAARDFAELENMHDTRKKYGYRPATTAEDMLRDWFWEVDAKLAESKTK